MRLGLSGEEISRLGEEIYDRDIREHVEAAHRGDIVAIDVDSGAWAVAETVLGAAERLREQYPEATNVWSVRAGHRAVYSFAGGSALREP